MLPTGSMRYIVSMFCGTLKLSEFYYNVTLKIPIFARLDGLIASPQPLILSLSFCLSL
jgi:hypothetical protein